MGAIAIRSAGVAGLCSVGFAYLFFWALFIAILAFLPGASELTSGTLKLLGLSHTGKADDVAVFWGLVAYVLFFSVYCLRYAGISVPKTGPLHLIFGTFGVAVFCAGIAYLIAQRLEEPVEMLSPRIGAESRLDADPPPPVQTIETVVSESSRAPNRTLPTLPIGSRAAVPAMQPSTPLEDFHGTVRLRAQIGGGVSEDGLTLQYCCAGALSSAAATSAAPAGRSYLEAMFIAEAGRQGAGALTRLGVGAASSAPDFSAESLRYAAPTRMLNSGEIVGVLIDTDLRRVEYYVKGQLVSARDLYDLRTTGLGLWVAVSAGHGGAGSSDRWVLNFGAAPFIYPPRESILTYEGRIHQQDH